MKKLLQFNFLCECVTVFCKILEYRNRHAWLRIFLWGGINLDEVFFVTIWRANFWSNIYCGGISFVRKDKIMNFVFFATKKVIPEKFEYNLEFVKEASDWRINMVTQYYCTLTCPFCMMAFYISIFMLVLLGLLINSLWKFFNKSN